MTNTIGSLSFVIDGKPAEAGAQVVVRSIQSIRDAAKKVGSESSNELGQLTASFKKLSEIKAPTTDTVQRMGAFAAMARQLRSISAPSDDVTNKLNNFFSALNNLKAPSSAAISRLAAIAPVLTSLQGIRAPSSATSANLSSFFDALANAKTPRPGLIQAIGSLSTVLGGKFNAPSAGTTQNLTNFFQALGSIQVPRNLQDVVSALNQIALAANNAGTALRGLRSGLNSLNTGAGGGAGGHLHGVQNGLQGVLKAGTPLHHMLFQTRAAFQGFFAALGIRELVSVNIEIQQVTAALQALTGSAYAAGGQFSYIMNLATRFGVDIGAASVGYKRLLAAIEGTSFTTQDAQKMFTNISKAARVLGLDSENTMGVFRALEQIMSKGSLQAEELRGQLGDRLPGAFNMFAKAMGVSTAELGKLMKDGKITGDVLHDSLIKFTDLYAQKVEGGMVSATQMMQAELARLLNSVKMASVAIGEGGLNEAIAGMARDLTSFLSSPEARESFRELGNIILMVQQNFLSLASVIGTMFVVNMLRSAALVTTFVTGVRTLGPVAGYANAALTTLATATLPALVAGLRTAAVSFALLGIPAAVVGGIVYLTTRTDELASATRRAVAANKELVQTSMTGGGRTAYALEQAAQQTQDQIRDLENKIRRKQSELDELNKKRNAPGGESSLAEHLLNNFFESGKIKAMAEAAAGVKTLEENLYKLRMETEKLRDQNAFKDALTALQELQEANENGGRSDYYVRSIAATKQLTDLWQAAVASGNMNLFREGLKGITDELTRMSAPAGAAAASLDYVLKTAVPDLAKADDMKKRVSEMRKFYTGKDENGKPVAVPDGYREELERKAKASGYTGTDTLGFFEDKLMNTLKPNKRANASAESVQNSFENLRASLTRTIDDLAETKDASENFFESINKRGAKLSTGQVAELSALRDLGVAWKDAQSSAEDYKKAIDRVSDGSEISVKELTQLSSTSTKLASDLDKYAREMADVNLTEDVRNKAARKYLEYSALQSSGINAMTSAVKQYVEALKEQNRELQVTMGLERAENYSAQSAHDRSGIYDPLAMQKRRDAELAQFDLNNDKAVRQNELKLRSLDKALADPNLRAEDRANLNIARDATKANIDELNSTAGERRGALDAKYIRENETALRALRTSADSAREGQEEFNRVTKAYQDLLKQGILNEEEYRELFIDSRIRMLDAQKDFASGAERSMLKYFKSIGDNADIAERFFTRAFQGMEDVLVEFVQTGKFNFASMVDMMLKELARLYVQMQIMLPLKNALEASGGFGGLFSSIGGLFSSGPTDTGVGTTMPAFGDDAAGFGLDAAAFAGASAHGNVFSAANDNAMYRFAQGGAFSNSVVSSPTYFRFANGGRFSYGMMGEAGPEAVVPLRRTASGNLGVEIAGGTGGGGGVVVQIIDQRTGNAPQVKTQDGGTGPDGRKILKVLIQEEQRRSINSGEMDTTMKTNFGVGRVGVNRG